MNPTIVEPRPWVAHEKGSATGMHLPSRHLLRPTIVVAVLLIAVLVGVAGYLEKWLWMRQLDYTGIFWTLLSVQWVMFCSAFVFAFLYLWINLRQAAKNSAAFSRDSQAWRPGFLSRADADSQPSDSQPSIELSPRLLKAAVVLISAGVALFFATGFYAEWESPANGRSIRAPPLSAWWAMTSSRIRRGRAGTWSSDTMRATSTGLRVLLPKARPWTGLLPTPRRRISSHHLYPAVSI